MTLWLVRGQNKEVLQINGKSRQTCINGLLKCISTPVIVKNEKRRSSV